MLSSPRTRMRVRRSLPRLRLVLCSLPLILLLACSPAKQSFQGVDISGSDTGQHWQLIDQNGITRSLQDYHGQLLLVYFGFTQCPDMCPLTLSHLKQALALLGDAPTPIHVLFVTVDAEHDTPATMKTYLQPFGPQFTGLSGNAEALAGAAQDFKVYAKRNRRDVPGGAFEHSGFVFVLDRQGKPRLLYGPEATPAGMASDLKQLMRG